MRDPKARERVLITGFCDWQRVLDGATPRDPWRCEKNPSGRLLVGQLGTRDQTPPDPPLAGPLVRALAGGHDRRQFCYRLLPVTWGACKRVGDPGRHDVLVHLGLGVYDDDRAIQLERDAWPWRRGVDATGHELDEALIDDEADAEADAGPRLRIAGVPPVLEGSSELRTRIDGLDGAEVGTHRVRVTAARSDNVFLCNETHWHALRAARSGRVRRAYFVHLPPADDEADLVALATSVAALVDRL